MSTQEILTKLPFSKPFLFVDEILQVDESGIEGAFFFDKNLDFYKGHFKGHPVTPGVVLTEVMVQIGLACFGIYLLNDKININTVMSLTSTEMEFLKPVFPNEKVTVISEKIYFRFGKLKCKVRMINSKDEEVCRGTIAGMVNLK